MRTPRCVAFLAHLDELVARALEPGRLIRPSSCQTVRKRSHMPRIAQHRPVLDQLADGEAVEQLVVHAQFLSVVQAGIQYTRGRAIVYWIAR